VGVLVLFRRWLGPVAAVVVGMFKSAAAMLKAMTGEASPFNLGRQPSA
jgi:hypothetical protein